jgi:peroxiredoxin
LGQLREIEPELNKFDWQLIGISADRPEKVCETADKYGIAQLLSDNKMSAAQSLGIAYRVDDATLKQLQQYGIDIEAASGEKHHVLPVPAVFLIGTDGQIKFQYVHPDYKIRLDPELLLTAARIIGKS